MTVVEGEVVEVATTTDVEVRVAALRDLPAESQVHAVTVMLSDARTRLLAASAVHDLPSIREIKACAATLQEIAKQLRLGKEMQLEAAEFVRRAERAIGVGIREGQARGEIASRINPGGGPTSDYQRNGKTVHIDGLRQEKTVLASPTDYAKFHELHGRDSTNGIYAMTDGVGHEDFERAIDAARQEGNLSRSNVARKARAKAKQNEPPLASAPPKVRKTARARKLIAHMSIDLHNYALAIAELDPAEIDAAAAHADIMHMFNSIGAIRSFLKKVNKQV